MGEESIVCDTSLLLYLGRIKKVTILPALYKEVYVPEKVALELDAGRLLRANTIDPSMLDWVNVVSVSEKVSVHAHIVISTEGRNLKCP